MTQDKEIKSQKKSGMKNLKKKLQDQSVAQAECDLGNSVDSLDAESTKGKSK